MNEIFPKLIQDQLEAVIPLGGITNYLSQAETQQILFMQFKGNIELSEYTNGAEMGIVLAGKISMEKAKQPKSENSLLAIN